MNRRRPRYPDMRTPAELKAALRKVTSERDKALNEVRRLREQIAYLQRADEPPPDEGHCPA